MSGDVIEWLRSEEGEAWSRSRHQHNFFNGGPAPSPVKDPGPVNQAEDPAGRLPIKGPALIAATGTDGAGR